MNISKKLLKVLEHNHNIFTGACFTCTVYIEWKKTIKATNQGYTCTGIYYY